MRRDTVQQWLVFGLLVAIGVVGRWGQPQWNVTPLAATALFSGYYFSNRGIALLVPLLILTITNFALAPHNSALVMASVYLAMAIPIWLGDWLQRIEKWPTRIVAGSLAALVSSAFFYLFTNFAVWAFTPNYPYTLAKCYSDAIPFYRWMVVGDLVYTAALFGCYAIARQFELRSAPAGA